MEKGTIIINGTGNVELLHVREFLAGIEEIYNHFCALEELTEGNALVMQHGGSPRISDQDFCESPELPLTLMAVKLNSPGFWEFFGRLNPLEFIRHLLKDLHERKKDISYRNDAEKERLNCQNLILQNKMIKERIELLLKVGVHKNDIQHLLIEQFGSGVNALLQAQDRQICSKAEIKTPKMQQSR